MLNVLFGGIIGVAGAIYDLVVRNYVIQNIQMCIRDRFVSIPPKYSVSEIMVYLKGTSSLMILDRHANLQYKYGNRHFWCRGYYVDTVGKNADVYKRQL